MTNQEAINNINALYCICGQKDFWDAKFEETMKVIVNELSEHRWVPVTERLPEKEGRYLCYYTRYECIDFGLYKDGDWYLGGVVAWMPLPEPYEESEV